MLDVLLVEGAMRWSWDVAGVQLAVVSRVRCHAAHAGLGPDDPLMREASCRSRRGPRWRPSSRSSSLIIGINLSADALAKALGIDRAQKAPV